MRPTMNAIDMVVSDINATTTFYRLLGVEFEVDPAYPDHASCDLPNGLHLMLNTEKLTGMARPAWTPAMGGPRAFLSFQVADPAAVDAAYGELTGAGYRGFREPWDAFWGMRYAAVLDPDGNGVDLYAPLPSE